MKTPVFLCAVLALSIVFGYPKMFAQAPANASLSGKIENPTGGGLSVKLKPAAKNPLALYDGYLAQVAADGAFRFEDVQPGSYVLVAEGLTFIPTEYGASGPGQRGTPIDLKAGQDRKGANFRLFPKHVVCGTVTDEQGRPVPNAGVAASFHRPDSNRISFDDIKRMGTTADDAGNYRLPNLPPGEYFLQAGYSWYSGSRILTQNESEVFSNAEPVEVGPDTGSECRENIRTGTRSGWYVHYIRGKIADDPELGGRDVFLSLQEVNSTGAAMDSMTAGPVGARKPGDSFALTPRPGRYRLVLSGVGTPRSEVSGQSSHYVISSQEFTMGDKEIDGFTLGVEPFASLSGHVKMDGIALETTCPTGAKTLLRIQKEGDSEFSQAVIPEDGLFSFRHISPGSYTVRLFPTQRGSAYIKSILVDGRPVVGRKIEISTAASHTLEVVLSGNAAEASGHVPPDEPVERYQVAGTHPKAFVSGKVLFDRPNPPLVKLWSVRFNSPRSYEYSTKPGTDGSFHFDSVDPGIYVLLTHGPGYDLTEYGAAYPGAEGTAITVTAGQRMKGLVLKAAHNGPSICGKVLDALGLPVSDAYVSAWLRPPYSESFYVAGVKSDDYGTFQFPGLQRGQYFLGASWDVSDRSGKITHSERGYYPFSPNLDGAQLIEVSPARDAACGHSIRMQVSAEFHIRAKLESPIPLDLGDHFDASLIETNAAGAEVWGQSRESIIPDHDFEFSKVRPGHYRIVLTGYHGEKPMISSGPCGPLLKIVALLEVIVSDGDLDNLEIKPDPHLSVTGEIQFQDIPKEWRAFNVEAQTISLTSETDSCQGGSAHLNPQGSFAIENLLPGTYRVEVNLAGVQGDELYVKSMLSNGSPVQGRQITLTPEQPAKLAIVVSNDGGDLDVHIRPSGPPVEEYRYDEPCQARVAVVPGVWLIPDVIPVDDPRVVMGASQISRVPPGRYHAVAGENFNFFHYSWTPRGYSAWQDLTFLAAMRQLGTPVEVSPGQKINLSVLDVTAKIQDLLAKYNEVASHWDHCARGCNAADVQDESENKHVSK